MFTPTYLTLYRTGELAVRAATAREMLAACPLCPRLCEVNRLSGKTGICKTGAQARIASHGPHFGEEAPLVGQAGSGTIFISRCNLGCVFCQNFEISHLGHGIEVSDGQLAAMMLALQKQGCHNINIVTPSHVVPQLLTALLIAVDQGLNIPLVYNTSAYDRVETLQLLDGVVDIYMPDFKFWEKTTAKQLAKAPDYPEQARAAIKEMYRQVGDLSINHQGLAERGLLVRHLVMPGQLAETREILRFLAAEISSATYINLMDQYHPCGRAREFPTINRPLTREEYHQARQLAHEFGLQRLDHKDLNRFFRMLGDL